MDLWTSWKKGFDTWENHTAAYVEHVMRSPLLLGPSGKVLSAVMRAKAQADKAQAAYWAALGLPTRRDQERLLHAVNQLGSRVMDLEAQLADATAELGRKVEARTTTKR